MLSPKKEKENKAVDKSMIQCIIFLRGHQTNLEVAVKNISVPGAELGGVCGFQSSRTLCCCHHLLTSRGRLRKANEMVSVICE